jgi:adenylate cyclase
MEKEIAILMADLTGYTAMTDVHGGASAAQIVNRYMKIVDAATYGTTKVVQRIGDQVVMIAENALDLMTTATQINALTLEENHFLSIHAGMHYGPIFIERGDLFGSTINVAARIMNIASRGQILGSSNFLSQVPTAQQHLFKSIGIHKLKNVMNAIELFELQQSSDTSITDVDPVCHMHISSTQKKITFSYQGINYQFCSARCMSIFQDSPERFISEKQHL